MPPRRRADADAAPVGRPAKTARVELDYPRPFFHRSLGRAEIQEDIALIMSSMKRELRAPSRYGAANRHTDPQPTHHHNTQQQAVLTPPHSPPRHHAAPQQAAAPPAHGGNGRAAGVQAQARGVNNNNGNKSGSPTYAQHVATQQQQARQQQQQAQHQQHSVALQSAHLAPSQPQQQQQQQQMAQIMTVQQHLAMQQQHQQHQQQQQHSVMQMAGPGGTTMHVVMQGPNGPQLVQRAGGAQFVLGPMLHVGNGGNNNANGGAQLTQLGGGAALQGATLQQLSGAGGAAGAGGVGGAMMRPMMGGLQGSGPIVYSMPVMQPTYVVGGGN